MRFTRVPTKEDFDWLSCEMTGFMRTQILASNVELHIYRRYGTQNVSVGPVGRCAGYAQRDARRFGLGGRSGAANEPFQKEEVLGG